ncbi:MAG: hypothetical protein GY759_03180 [Chloroflexi bacterium]|nr:hypothetical protein [Chloroflexota bacterium]
MFTSSYIELPKGTASILVRRDFTYSFIDFSGTIGNQRASCAIGSVNMSQVRAWATEHGLHSFQTTDLLDGGVLIELVPQVLFFEKPIKISNNHLISKPGFQWLAYQPDPKNNPLWCVLVSDAAAPGLAFNREDANPVEIASLYLSPTATEAGGPIRQWLMTQGFPVVDFAWDHNDPNPVYHITVWNTGYMELGP